LTEQLLCPLARGLHSVYIIDFAVRPPTTDQAMSMGSLASTHDWCSDNYVRLRR